MTTQRPIRPYLFTFVWQGKTPEGQPPPARTTVPLVQSGNTPCQARRFAFEELERVLVREQLPTKDWKLIQQKQLPMTGSSVHL